MTYNNEGQSYEHFVKVSLMVLSEIAIGETS